MRRERFYLCYLCVLLLVAAVLSGCATGRNTQNTSVAPSESVSVKEEPIKEVKISEFILGAGDKIEIVVYRQEDLKRTLQVDTSGKIFYPLVGDIQASGLSIFQLRDRIRDGLSKYIADPQVSVSISSVHSQKVIVLGEVKSPGLFPLDAPLTALEAISKAGGFTLDAKQRSVVLIRGGLGNPDLATLDMDNVFTGNDPSQNVSLLNGDILYVPATEIANVSRFFDHLAKILSPIIQTGYFLGLQSESDSVAVPTR